MPGAELQEGDLHAGQDMSITGHTFMEVSIKHEVDALAPVGSEAFAELQAGYDQASPAKSWARCGCKQATPRLGSCSCMCQLLRSVCAAACSALCAQAARSWQWAAAARWAVPLI